MSLLPSHSYWTLLAKLVERSMTDAAQEIPTLAATGSSKDDLLNSIDGPFQLAEYLACRVRADPHDVKGLVEVPKNGQDADRDVVCHVPTYPVLLACAHVHHSCMDADEV